jgi:hypothetical protein
VTVSQSMNFGADCMSKSLRVRCKHLIGNGITHDGYFVGRVSIARVFVKQVLRVDATDLERLLGKWDKRM